MCYVSMMKLSKILKMCFEQKQIIWHLKQVKMYMTYVFTYSISLKLWKLRLKNIYESSKVQKVKRSWEEHFTWTCFELLTYDKHVIMMMKCFCGMVDRRKVFSLISSRDHCQRSSQSWISDTPRAGYEPEQSLSSGSVEWSWALVITTTPRRHIFRKLEANKSDYGLFTKLPKTIVPRDLSPISCKLKSSILSHLTNLVF